MRVLAGLFVSVWLIFAADNFSGKWTSSENAVEGTINIQLSEPAHVTFTLGGQEVKTKVLSAKKEESKFELRYEFDLDGTKLISTLTGTVSGDKAEGRYRTTTAEGDSAVDGGTFSAAAK